MSFLIKLLISSVLVITTLKLSTSQEIAFYDEIKDAVNHPEKILIDVREPEELEDVGKFPNAINIPVQFKPAVNVTKLDWAFHISSEEFFENFHREKPKFNDPLIFVCKKGIRAKIAADKAVDWGYTNVKYYEASWNEWCVLEKLKCYENP